MDQTSISIYADAKKALADYCRENGSLKMVVVCSEAVQEYLERKNAHGKTKSKK